MNRLVSASLLALALAGAACSTEEAVARRDSTPPGIQPARDGNIAIRQELESARNAGTVEAYDLFIARHPDHPLAEIARCERERVARGRPREGCR